MGSGQPDFGTAIFERALKLTQSANPNEKASAIYVLGDYYTKNLGKLSGFEGKSVPVEVRRVVTTLYESSGSIDQVLRYADDPDDQVRSHVFFTIERNSEHVRDVFYCSELGTSEDCEMVALPSGLGFQLKERILFLPKASIALVAASKETLDGRDGLLLASSTPTGDAFHLVVAPLRPYHDVDETPPSLPRLVASVLGKSVGSTDSDLNSQRIAVLWKLVPRPKQEG